MHESSITILGLPGSGKTTFLAALWHVIAAREIPTSLSFDTLKVGNAVHLNAIAARWRDARVQERTATGGNQTVSIRLRTATGECVSITFPDVAGEGFQRMWSERLCDDDLVQHLASDRVLLFIHADRIRAPRWVIEQTRLSQVMGLASDCEEPAEWNPDLAPTQVQLVGLLQLLQEPPLTVGRRRLAVVLSAWDKVAAEGLQPSIFFAQHLPLMHQYLSSQTSIWDWEVFGLSAQGGEYDPADRKEPTTEAADTMRKIDIPSERIALVVGDSITHDLTRPLAWLIE